MRTPYFKPGSKLGARGRERKKAWEKRNERFPTFIRPRCTENQQQKENGVDRLRICKIGKETTITSLVRGQENPNAASPMPASRRGVPQKEQSTLNFPQKNSDLKLDFSPDLQKH